MPRWNSCPERHLCPRRLSKTCLKKVTADLLLAVSVLQVKVRLDDLQTLPMNASMIPKMVQIPYAEKDQHCWSECFQKTYTLFHFLSLWMLHQTPARIPERKPSGSDSTRAESDSLILTVTSPQLSRTSQSSVRILSSLQLESLLGSKGNIPCTMLFLYEGCTFHVWKHKKYSCPKRSWSLKPHFKTILKNDLIHRKLSIRCIENAEVEFKRLIQYNPPKFYLSPESFQGGKFNF